MSCHRRIVWRAVLGAVAATTLYLGSAASIAMASAHVEASSTNAVRGGTALVAFQVPNESTTGAATTALTVDLSAVSGVQTELKPGWSTKLDRAAGSVTWTADPDGGIPVNEFAVFRISVQLPNADTVSFPASQTYADGSVVKWDQPSSPGAAEPEHPAPTLVLSGSPTSPPAAQTPLAGAAAPTATATPEAQQPRAPADNTARVLAGAALLVGALGIGLALVVQRT